MNILTAAVLPVAAWFEMTPGTPNVADLENADLTLTTEGLFVEFAQQLTPQVEKVWFVLEYADGRQEHWDGFVNVRPDGICRVGSSEGAWGRSGKDRLHHHSNCYTPPVPLPASVVLALSGLLALRVWA